MARAGLLLVDLLVGVGGVEPAAALLLLPLGVGLLPLEPQVVRAALLLQVAEGDGRGGHLHLAARPRALRLHGEAVGVAGAVTLETDRGGGFCVGRRTYARTARSRFPCGGTEHPKIYFFLCESNIQVLPPAHRDI